MVNGAPLGVLHLAAGNLYGGVERIVAELPDYLANLRDRIHQVSAA